MLKEELLLWARIMNTYTCNRLFTFSFNIVHSFVSQVIKTKKSLEVWDICFMRKAIFEQEHTKKNYCFAFHKPLVLYNTKRQALRPGYLLTIHFIVIKCG